MTTTNLKAELLELLAEKERRLKTRMLDRYYPDEGPLRRELYPKHMAFFEAGSSYRERCMMAANRVGKSLGAGGYEMALHLTGLYPTWWKGRRFAHPIMAWAAGKTSKTTRDIIQKILLGDRGSYGTGMIPAAHIERTTPKAGIPDAVEDIYVRHISGGTSVVTLKSYDQEVDAFMGTERHVIWLDEEPKDAIYSECLIRTMTVQGLIMATFTPLNGLSDVVLRFLPDGKIPEEGKSDKFIIQVTWDEVPHLTEKDKKELWASLPPHERQARSKGTPQLGSGAIYPINEEEITVEPFKIPHHWPRCFAMDVGWNRTAAIWLAHDRESDTYYAYSEYSAAEALPAVHARAIQARGAWIPGVIDPASRGRSQNDGSRLVVTYEELGLPLEFADNAVEAGIYEVWERLSTGRLKFFSNLQNTFAEFRIYRRDKNGKVVKQNDHLMDCLRYGTMACKYTAITEPRGDDEYSEMRETGRSRVAGY